MDSIIFKNGIVIDPFNGICKKLDVFVANGIIEDVRESIICEGAKIIDATGMWVVPGLIDMHVHLREPGFTQKETIETGTYSAAAGGFTTICAMPNTNPATDNAETVTFVKEKALKEGIVNVLPVGAITEEQKGEILTDFVSLKNAGVCAYSEDGKTVENSELMKQALINAKVACLPVLSHCEEEVEIIERDINLWKQTGGRLHICHVSTKKGVELITKEKNEFLTAEACPHHFALTKNSFDGKDTNYKMSPPLREQEDLEAIIWAIKNNIIEVIATDHAPHTYEDKNTEYEKAANGIIGLETAVPIAITELVRKNVLTPYSLIEKLTKAPAEILRINKGHLSKGACADITVIDPEEQYVIDVDSFKSKSRNCPFGGRKVYGRVKYTVVSGRIVYDNRYINRQNFRA